METFEHRPFPFGVGVYTFFDAARYIGASTRDLRRWVRAYHPIARTGPRAPLWESELLPWRRKGLGFHDLIELRYVQAMREAGAGMPLIRRTMELGRSYLGVTHPLSCERFAPYAERIVAEASASSRGRLEPCVRDQILSDFANGRLREGLDVEGPERIARWFPLPSSRMIVLDPNRRAGDPILAEAGVPTIAIAAAYHADNQDARFVAWQFEITEEEVNVAVDFETIRCAA
ncbi:hypothetical protein KPL74_19925 [Bacillus sp. NP157]|nr:hypothetical protein KPL74_19925 [Bacillus sp. NP157]